MDEFGLIVERYSGENEPKVGKSDASGKSDAISKLVEQARMRKRMREGKDDKDNDDERMDDVNGIEEDQDRKKKKKKSKKRKDNDVSKDEEVNEMNVDEDVNEGIEDKMNGLNESEEQEEEDNENFMTEEEANKSDEVSFAVIGKVKKGILKAVKPVLPHWLSNPNYFDHQMSDRNTEDSLGEFSNLLDASLITKLQQNKITSLFPVQKAVIPLMIKSLKCANLVRPRDICVSSPTGSGKTLAFVIPIIDHLLSRKVTAIRVLVILPVRDLAIQVHQVFEQYIEGTTLKVGLAIGQKSFQDEQNSLIKKSVTGNKYKSLVDILVATPGRLVDLIQRAEGFSLEHLEILVLDEADRMMGEIEFNWLEEIEKCAFGRLENGKYECCCHLGSENTGRLCVESKCSCSTACGITSRPIQKILFSATISHDPEKLKSISLFKPILLMATSFDSSLVAFDKEEASTSDDKTSKTLTLTPRKHMTPNELKQYMIISKPDKKPLIIWHLIEDLKYRKVLCFTGSVQNTHRLYLLLKQIPNIVAAEFSSRMNAKKREKVLTQFSQGKIDLIVCSDIFARGIDLEGIKCVICYDPPRNETAYIHRIGRTARAGHEGTSITLISPTQLAQFTIIIRRAHEKHKQHNDNQSDDGNSSTKSGSNSELHVEKLVIKESALKPLQDKYKKALSGLSKDLSIQRKKTTKFRKSFINRVIPVVSKKK